MTSDLHPLRDTDIEWAVDRLERRRAGLRPCAPLFWKAADDARERHIDFLRQLVILAGAIAYRTDDSVLIAARSRGQWVLDDVAVDEDAWGSDGEALWQAFASHAHGEKVRMLCPVPEVARLAFARAKGLEVVESWWHLEVPVTNEPTPMAATTIADARAQIVIAPPVYNPGGPILFLTDPSSEALAAAPAAAVELGCPLVVVAQSRPELADELTAAGFRRQTDFCEGVVA